MTARRRRRIWRAVRVYLILFGRAVRTVLYAVAVRAVSTITMDGPRGDSSGAGAERERARTTADARRRREAAAVGGRRWGALDSLRPLM